MVTFLLAEAGGLRAGVAGRRSRPEPARLEPDVAARRDADGQALLGLGMAQPAIGRRWASWRWWIHLFILLFFLVYLPYSKHMHLLWTPFAVFFARVAAHKGVLGPAAAGGGGSARPPRRPWARSPGGSC